MIAGHIEICDGVDDLGRDAGVRLDHGPRRLHRGVPGTAALRDGGGSQSVMRTAAASSTIAAAPIGEATRAGQPERRGRDGDEGDR